MNIVITGGTSGTGFELAKFFSSDTKNEVFAIGRSLLNQEEIKFSNLNFLQADLSKEDETSKIFKEIYRKVNEVDILINCAATWTGGVSIKDTSAEKVKNSLDLNFFTVFNPIQEVLKNKNDSDIESPLKIINLGATASLRGGSKMFLFAMAKSSLRILSQSIARELSPQGVHVCHIIIDGLIYNSRTRQLNPDLVSDRYIRMSSLVELVNYIINQKKDCWTHEIDLRPYNESF